MEVARTYTAFAGDRLVASGDLRTMLLGTKKHVDEGAERVLVFEDSTGRQVDFDFTGTPEEVVVRALGFEPKAGPGRPKLGVVSREVTLLPRHWEWLERHPQGVSAALRRLVEEARKSEPHKGRATEARDAASKFMWAMAGNLPNFEEATRALFANEHSKFDTLIADWPKDIRAHLTRLVREVVQLGTD